MDLYVAEFWRRIDALNRQIGLLQMHSRKGSSCYARSKKNMTFVKAIEFHAKASVRGPRVESTGSIGAASAKSSVAVRSSLNQV